MQHIVNIVQQRLSSLRGNSGQYFQVRRDQSNVQKFSSLTRRTIRENSSLRRVKLPKKECIFEWSHFDVVCKGLHLLFTNKLDRLHCGSRVYIQQKKERRKKRIKKISDPTKKNTQKYIRLKRRILWILVCRVPHNIAYFWQKIKNQNFSNNLLVSFALFRK